jgi:hypothetical protein
MKWIERSMKLRKMGETHKAVIITYTYRAMVTHLSLFDDIGLCRYVAQIAITKITKYTPVY